MVFYISFVFYLFSFLQPVNHLSQSLFQLGMYSDMTDL